MKFDSRDLYTSYAKYAAVLGLVASLGASLSFNPESKLIAREDYKKSVQQMSLASATPPDKLVQVGQTAKVVNASDQAKKTAIQSAAANDTKAKADADAKKKHAQQVAASKAAANKAAAQKVAAVKASTPPPPPPPAATTTATASASNSSQANDPNLDLERRPLNPGESRTTTMTNSTITYTYSKDGQKLLVRCEPTCQTCSKESLFKASRGDTLDTHGVNSFKDLVTIAMGSDKIKSCMDGATLDSKGNLVAAAADKDGKKGKSRSFRMAKFPPKDESETSCDLRQLPVRSSKSGDDKVNMDSETWTSQEWTDFGDFTTCFLAEQVKKCETQDMSEADTKDYDPEDSSGWPDNGVQRRCSGLVETFYENNLKDKIQQGLTIKAKERKYSSGFYDLDAKNSRVHKAAFKVLESILKFKPARYISENMQEGMTSMVRDATLSLASKVYAKDNDQIQANLEVCGNLMNPADPSMGQKSPACVRQEIAGLLKGTRDAQSVINGFSALESTPLEKILGRTDTGEELYKKFYQEQIQMASRLVTNLGVKQDPNAIINANLTETLANLAKTGTANGATIRLETAEDGSFRIVTDQSTINNGAALTTTYRPPSISANQINASQTTLPVSDQVVNGSVGNRPTLINRQGNTPLPPGTSQLQQQPAGNSGSVRTAVVQ